MNDPIHGIIHFPFIELYEVINSPEFQRLRRIKQMGLSHYVFPGAVHTRFSHAIGTAYIMNQAITKLKNKGIAIDDEEHFSALAVALLHDIGHGPFSHALEGKLLQQNHELISLLIMNRMNERMNSKLDLAIKIFQNKYERPFFYQLVSSQIDVDRMDYLMRDNYFAGVTEGQIGLARLIENMHVVDEGLIFHEKSISSIENFFMARWLMYKDVYLHKTGLKAECMLKIIIEEIKKRKIKTKIESIDFLLYNTFSKDTLEAFLNIDDTDIIVFLKKIVTFAIPSLTRLAEGLLKRNLIPIKLSDKSINCDFLNQSRHKCSNFNISLDNYENYILSGVHRVLFYKNGDTEVKILKNNESISKFSDLYKNQFWLNRNINLYYQCNGN